MPELYNLLVLSGSLQAYMDDETLPAVTMDGLTWDEATKLCGFAFRQGYTVIVRQAGGKDDAEAESRKKL